MSNAATIHFEPAKLKNVIHGNHITFSTLAKQIGYSMNGLRFAVNRGTMTRFMWAAVSTRLGITIKDVQKDPEPVPEPEQKKTEATSLLAGIFSEILTPRYETNDPKKVIETAVYCGMMRAFRDRDKMIDSREPYRECIAPVDNGKPD